MKQTISYRQSSSAQSGDTTTARQSHDVRQLTILIRQQPPNTNKCLHVSNSLRRCRTVCLGRPQPTCFVGSAKFLRVVWEHDHEWEVVGRWDHPMLVCNILLILNRLLKKKQNIYTNLGFWFCPGKISFQSDV